jgi:hypothetical protein
MKTDREKRGGKKKSYFLSFWFFLWMCVFVVCVCMQQQTIAPKSGLFRRPRPCVCVCVCVCERSLDPRSRPFPSHSYRHDRAVCKEQVPDGIRERERERGRQVKFEYVICE